MCIRTSDRVNKQEILLPVECDRIAFLYKNQYYLILLIHDGIAILSSKRRLIKCCSGFFVVFAIRVLSQSWFFIYSHVS